MHGMPQVSQGFQAPGMQDMSHGQYGGAPPQSYNQGFPGTQPPRPGAPGMQPGGMQQPQQKKLDPDQMPSPVSSVNIQLHITLLKEKDLSSSTWNMPGLILVTAVCLIYLHFLSVH